VQAGNRGHQAQAKPASGGAAGGVQANEAPKDMLPLIRRPRIADHQGDRAARAASNRSLNLLLKGFNMHQQGSIG